MPNRIIKESCRTSLTLDQLSDGAERMFWRLTTVADDFGRFEADPRILLSSCFPLRIDVLKIKTISDWFTEMLSCGLVTTYDVNGKHLAFFNTWDVHQRKRAINSKYPQPTPDNICQQYQSSPNPLSSDNICQQMTSNVSESSIRGIEESRVVNSSARRMPAGFVEFWSAYPVKTGKGQAEKAWKKQQPPLDQVLAAIEAQKRWRLNGNGAFRPEWKHPATWLNGECWNDELELLAQGPPVCLAPVKPMEYCSEEERLKNKGRLRTLIQGIGK